LGLNKQTQRKIRQDADKYRQVFKEDWDASEDTSKDINPLYSHRQDPKLLFGKGRMGGVSYQHRAD